MKTADFAISLWRIFEYRMANRKNRDLVTSVFETRFISLQRHLVHINVTSIVKIRTYVSIFVGENTLMFGTR